jgi:hypothetical protein|tara:strand:+ start:389 stop:724 length:336 start_codon:yes stop_codon:yes gene_type:complete
MSSQSISLNYKSKHVQDTREILIYNFEQYFYEKHFKLGKGADLEEMNYYRELKKILCNDNCEIVNYINSKLNGELQQEEDIEISLLSNNLKSYNSKTEVTNNKTFWEIKSW